MPIPSLQLRKKTSLMQRSVAFPVFQLPTFAKRDALPKGDFSYMFVKGIHAFCEI